MKQAGTINPVMLLDEIDKLGVGLSRRSRVGAARSARPGAEPDLHRPLPGRALRPLERALHHDRQLARQIPRPLRDRMEIIEIGGYTEDEKIEIGRQLPAPEAAGGPRARPK